MINVDMISISKIITKLRRLSKTNSSQHNKFPLNLSNNNTRKIFYFDQLEQIFKFDADFENWCNERNIKIYLHRGNICWNGTEQDRVELLLTWIN